MSTMKLDLSEWKNLAISHMTLMAQQLNQVSVLRQEDLDKIDSYWNNIIRSRLEAWWVESAVAMQEQQRAQPQPAPQEQPAPQPANGSYTSQRTPNGPPKPAKRKGGWPAGKARKPKAAPTTTDLPVPQ